MRERGKEGSNKGGYNTLTKFVTARDNVVGEPMVLRFRKEGQMVVPTCASQNDH